MTGMALYDTCTDGLALDTTPAEDEGTVQGIMVGGRALGVVIISATLGLLAQLTTWTVAFWTLAAITLLPLLLVIAYREPERSPPARFSVASVPRLWAEGRHRPRRPGRSVLAANVRRQRNRESLSQ